MKTSLLIVDMQQSLLDEGPWQANDLLERTTTLLRAARAAAAPIAFVTDRRLEPDPTLHSSLERRESDILVEKGYCDAFLETTLWEELKTRGVERLIVAGLQTDYCIDTTCRRAASLGYEVLLVRDGHSTFDHEHLSAEQIVAHHNRVLDGFPAGRGSVAVIDAKEVMFV